jgi:hypothetical protein
MRDELEDENDFDPTATLVRLTLCSLLHPCFKQLAKPFGCLQGPKPTPGGLLGAGPQPQVSPLSIVPPSTTDDLDHADDVRTVLYVCVSVCVCRHFDDSMIQEELGRPMSHHEMKRKIAQTLKK